MAITKPPSTTGAWIVAGAAGAATVAGGIFGVMALSAKSKYDGAPSDDHADDVARNSMLADICFGSALTLGLASLVMFTTSDGNEAPTSSGRIRPVRHLAVTPLLSPKAAERVRALHLRVHASESLKSESLPSHATFAGTSRGKVKPHSVTRWTSEAGNKTRRTGCA